MAWVILAGLDRSGKTTVAEYYKSQGYEYIHLSAPDKKYYEPGYTGPSYLDEMLELMMKYDGVDTVWDRSWYGEKVWPEVYGRKPLLNDEDFEVIHEYEYNNQAVKYLLHDPNIKAHWERIQKDSGLKPISKEQFMKAGRANMRLIAEDNFIQKRMEDFPKVEKPIEEKPKAEAVSDEVAAMQIETAKSRSGQQKLEEANAINTILKSNIIRKKGPIYDALEADIRNYLDKKLSVLLGEPQEDFSPNEIKILKQFCNQMSEKLKK